MKLTKFQLTELNKRVIKVAAIRGCSLEQSFWKIWNFTRKSVGRIYIINTTTNNK